MEIAIRFPGGKRVAADIRQHTVETDQRRLTGGDDTAPEPYELFLASLATCAGIYVKGFCEARGIRTDGVRLVQRHAFDSQTMLVSEVALDIEVPGDFPAKYHKALTRVVGQCAVKKTLEAPPSFDARTVVAS